jgi:DnaJ-class molecular chaperone
MQVERSHPSETGDSQVSNCPTCDGTGVHPYYHNACPTCCGTGFLLQQRFDQNGRPIRVDLIAAKKGK